MVYNEDKKQQGKIDTWNRVSKAEIRAGLAEIVLKAANYQGKEFPYELNKEYRIGLMYLGSRPGIEITLYRKDEKPDRDRFYEVLTLLPYPLKSNTTVLVPGKKGKEKFLRGTVYPKS